MMERIVLFALIVLFAATMPEVIPAYAQDSSDQKTFESAATAAPKLEPSVRFTVMEADSHGCHKAVFCEKGRRYYLYRDRYLVAEARWLYCLGKIDHLPTWAR